MALKWKTAVIHTPELDLHQHVKTPTVRTVPVTGVFLPAWEPLKASHYMSWCLLWVRLIISVQVLNRHAQTRQLYL